MRHRSGHVGKAYAVNPGVDRLSFVKVLGFVVARPGYRLSTDGGSYRATG